LKYSPGKHCVKYLVLLCLLLGGTMVFAQGPNTIPVAPNKDTSLNKTNTGKWDTKEPVTVYEKLNSAKIYIPDTAIHTYQRAKFTQPWYRDLGNLGSPANNLFFTPEDRFGPSLGYHVFDVYRFNIDSLNYYNTNKAFSAFSYQLGSKLEQTAGIMTTQNIKPNWNFAVEYRKTNSPGYYKIQRTNNDNASFSTNYKSLDKHYVLYAAMVYNKEQHDENGGIVIDSQLASKSYSDKRTVDVAYQSSAYSSNNKRSSVTNMQRDYTFLFQHSYMWGRTDTTYSADSTQYNYKLTPRFSITQKTEISTEKHAYKDYTPDSTRYTRFFNHSFPNKGNGYYNPSDGDSVFTQQKWFWADNKLLLNGFIGKADKQLQFSAGLGNRYDQFVSKPVSNIIKDSLPKQYYSIGLDRSSIVSNYFAGEIKKEALRAGEWEYGVNTKFILTGDDAGGFLLNAMIGKQLKNMLGNFSAGFQQQLNNAPYSFTNYENIYTKVFYTFNKESVTMLYAQLASPRFRLSGGVRNYVIGNYIYVNEKEIPAQNTNSFTITQGWIRKTFKVGNFYLDNELVYQNIPDNAPVNIPALMGRHQLSYERNMFKNRLKIATGIEVRYNSKYAPAGYDAVLNKFFYQKKTEAGNVPEASLFLNFRIKRFRAFIMGDNLQQLFNSNSVLYMGSTAYNFNGSGINYNPVYAAPDALIRFGFSWVMIN
jgi:Putative porin